MVLSYQQYKNKGSLIKDIKKEVLTNFKESDYKEEDKLNVCIHRIIDSFVSFISINDLNIYLNFFNDEDKKTIDKGMLPDEVLTDRFNRCVLFCLIEQDIYNIEEINKLQFN